MLVHGDQVVGGVRRQRVLEARGDGEPVRLRWVEEDGEDAASLARVRVRVRVRLSFRLRLMLRLRLRLRVRVRIRVRVRVRNRVRVRIRVRVRGRGRGRVRVRVRPPASVSGSSVASRRSTCNTGARPSMGAKHGGQAWGRPRRRTRCVGAAIRRGAATQGRATPPPHLV